MSVQGTLRRVDYDIATGNLQTARNRLHGLLNAYPANLEVRRRLGDIYWQLGRQELAGAYWSLEEPTTEVQQKAREAFTAHTNNRPLAMLEVINFRAPLTALEEGSFARTTLQELADRVKAERGTEVKFPYPDGSGGPYTRPAKAADDLMLWGCIMAILSSIILMLIGTWTVFRWVFG